MSHGDEVQLLALARSGNKQAFEQALTPISRCSWPTAAPSAATFMPPRTWCRKPRSSPIATWRSSSPRPISPVRGKVQQLADTELKVDRAGTARPADNPVDPGAYQSTPSGANHDTAPAPDGWQSFAVRAEIAPHFWVERTNEQTGSGYCLGLPGCQRLQFQDRYLRLGRPAARGSRQAPERDRCRGGLEPPPGLAWHRRMARTDLARGTGTNHCRPVIDNRENLFDL